MKLKILIIIILITNSIFSQVNDTTAVFKKRVLESTEVDFVSSYYGQDGSHAAVTGGIGTEKLTDFASNIVVAMPLNDDDILTVDAGVSAYTSASSSNVNPFVSSTTTTGASRNAVTTTSPPKGTPWQASTGASESGALFALNANYSHSTNDRNFLWNADVSVSTEFNYNSKGFGGGITKLFNNKNSEISLKSNVYLDNWKAIYPTELHEFGTYGANFQYRGYLNGVKIYNQNGIQSTGYLPSNFTEWDSTTRNSYSASVSFSQVVNKKSQFSIFFDVLQQQGRLSTPYQRVYFADKANYYVGVLGAGNSNITNYQNSNNLGIFQLADDIERMPDTRLKLPIGMRYNYYINEHFVAKTYYRYYHDNWGVNAHTFSVELPVKLGNSFTVYPMYRYYIQTQSTYFAPYETHLSTEQFYTSDYDLGAFNANQYGFGATYTDILAETKIFGLGIKNIDFRFNSYNRSDGLKANIGTIGIKFTTD